jgi:mannose-6-phosphate isomerase-like protein (cupin superfamily)
MDVVNIQNKLDLITEHWKPIIVGELNKQHIKLVKIKDKFPMHHHENEDELFLVIKGLLKMDYGDRVVEVKEGEFIIVPRGVKHRPIADSEVELLLFEPETTLNTGNLKNEFTVEAPEKK